MNEHLEDVFERYFMSLIYESEEEIFFTLIMMNIQSKYDREWMKK